MFNNIRFKIKIYLYNYLLNFKKNIYLNLILIINIKNIFIISITARAVLFYYSSSISTLPSLIKPRVIYPRTLH